ncbi:hypothetical protein [Streptomyces sp. 2P-4]|uniref:hypothetical protein n=1 Tax=Streptomyces sp. 2P-4 TaxID=2931974 RepID=UPI002540DA6B|nr:hypothetical protein [Streptomyces sp. 2P-4]
MTGRQLPPDCPCPRVRHADGSPLVIPSADCRHHGAHLRPLPPATVTPIRPGLDLPALASVVCDQDRGESPFGWSDPAPADMPAARPAP